MAPHDRSTRGPSWAAVRRRCLDAMQRLGVRMSRSDALKDGEAARSGLTRRVLCSLPLALACPAMGQPASAPSAPQGSSSDVRLALLIGNRTYPSPFDLPPMYKNVRDVKAALERWNFNVTSSTDDDPAALRQSIQNFAKAASAAPPDATILFYFTGHGLQVDAENLMLGAGVNPISAEDALLKGSLHLRRDVIDLLPRRPQGLSIAVIDACRTSLRDVQEHGGGLNQMEAPLGYLIAFSTGAGKPAIAPAVETRNTFYTESLVKVLGSASGETSFSELFRLVKLDVQNVMLNFPIAAIREFAQFPFIAENTRGRFVLAPRTDAGPAPQPRFTAEDESKLWSELQQSSWPLDVQRIAEEYITRFPHSELRGGAEVAREGAHQAVEALSRNDVRLFPNAFRPDTHEPLVLDEVRKAARGDKDAAARLARMYLRGENGIAPDRNRYEGWLQFASALGNGIACYELAVHYRRLGQPVLAAQFEARSRELGYTPPPTLDNFRK